MFVFGFRIVDIMLKSYFVPSITKGPNFFAGVSIQW